MKNQLLFAAAFLAVVARVQAGGFLIYEHGAAATGMCGARAAIADDPSTMYYNPAAITELDGVQLQLGTTGILPYTHYQPAGRPAQPRIYTTFDAQGNSVQEVVNDGENPADAKVMGFAPIYFYATWKIRDLPLAVGYGLTNPFGLGTVWPDTWDGRFITTETKMSTFFNNPVVALDIAELAGFKDRFKLSLAAGYTLVYGQAHLAKVIDLRVAEKFSTGAIQDPWAKMKLDGDAWGHGWNLALYAELPRQLAFGFSLRSGLSLPFDGTAKFSFPTEASRQARQLLAGLGTVFPDETGGGVTIDLPLHLNAGMAYLGVDRLKVAVDFYLAMFQSYDELAVRFECVDHGACSADLNQTLVSNWHESWQISIGAEYLLLDRLPIRAGWGTVSSPVPADTYDPSLPDGQRQLITVGAGWKGSWWKVDVGYMLAFWKGTKNNDVGLGDDLNPGGKANGKYTTYSHLLGLGFAARL